MVDPISESERSAFQRKLRAGTALLVAVSTGLVSVKAGASVGYVAASTLGGALVGWGLAWFVLPSGPAPAARKRERERAETGPENPFETGRERERGEDPGEQRAPRQGE